MLIYLLRHGDAAQNPSLHDSERPLTELGRRQSETVARFLQRSNASINTIFCSSLQRAQQMAQPTRELLRVEQLISTEYLVPGSDSRQLLEQINSNIAESVLLVGHEPYLGELLSMLVAGGTDVKVEFKKSTLSLVETTPPVRKGHGLLKWIITIEQMDMIR